LPDIIHLLPDNIANQIAAGEVIQRPASAVKELLENAVDAGATEISLVVNDAGKALIQVIDNGKGMSQTDALMSFQRHATSKIKNIEDLFRIHTMGFRGEALASIAAVSQVEIKTRKAENELGCYIEIENSNVIRMEPISTQEGTNISMKNLFFNVPARRNFLKTNASEMRQIADEFIRIGLSFPNIFFSLISNGQEMFHLETGTLKQRILQLLGSHYNSRLVAVQEKTDYLTIYGFVGKPDTAKKTRGDQYFFVNNRFIKSAYLNHSVLGAFQDMIPADSFPLYVLYIDIDPSRVDINVHPTKQEIKFEDEKIVYAFVQAAVKHALAQFSITPELDFDLDPEIQRLEAVSKPISEEKSAGIASSSLFQTFTKKNQAHLIEPDHSSNLTHWRDFYERPDNDPAGPIKETGVQDPLQEMGNWSAFTAAGLAVEGQIFQLQHTYIIAATREGLLLIRQQSAHERVLYERYVDAGSGKTMAVQHSLFPTVIQLATQDALILEELIADFNRLGYLIEPFGKDGFIVQGTPADLGKRNDKADIENILEQFKHFNTEMKIPKREKLIRALARQHSIKSGTALSTEEMKNLLEALFACMQPNATPEGNPTYIELKKDYLEQLFGK
jgi:DNA mismatch repair protein MutL